MFSFISNKKYFVILLNFWNFLHNVWNISWQNASMAVYLYGSIWQNLAELYSSLLVKFTRVKYRWRFSTGYSHSYIKLPFYFFWNEGFWIKIYVFLANIASHHYNYNSLQPMNVPVWITKKLSSLNIFFTLQDIFWLDSVKYNSIY